MIPPGEGVQQVTAQLLQSKIAQQARVISAERITKSNANRNSNAGLLALNPIIDMTNQNQSLAAA